MSNRRFFDRRLIFTAGALFAAILLPQSPAFGAASLSIAPVSWNIIGLDSNNVNVGPNNFPVGARVCNTGDAPATNVTSTYVWDSADPFIDFRPGSLTSFTGANAIPSLAAGACTDFYYEVTVTRNASAYNHTRRYHITATADTLGTVSTPTPRELYVEHLVSQSRNHVTDVKLNGASVPSGGTMTLVVGQTYTITLVGSTATNGYEQLESFVGFPNTVFQVLSVVTAYSADSSPFVPNPNSKLYGDACKWENNPNSPSYRSCLDVGKVGGNLTVTYQIKILQLPSPPLTNPQPLSSLIYDFSGSSYHYNSDYSTAARFALFVDPATVTIAKTFSPTPTTVNGVSVLTFTLTNPNPASVSGVNFTDTFPTSPGAMVVANPSNASTNGCGTPTFAPVAGAGSISFSAGTIAANGTCTIKVNVTAPAAGTYNNTSSHLFLGTTDTGNFATASLVVNPSPPPPVPVCGLALAQWVFPTGFNTSSPAPFATNTTVTASASPGAGITPIESSQNHTVTPAGTASWGSNGAFDSTGAVDTSQNDYFEFVIDTTNLSEVDLTFWARRTNNGPHQVVVFFGTSATPPGTLQATIGSPPGTPFPSAANAWESSGNIAFTTGLNPSGTTFFRIYGAFATNSTPGSDLYLDDVTFTGCIIPPPPTMTKSFSPSPVAVGATSTLTFTITNPSATIALTGVSFTDTLPSGLTVTSGSSAQCGGTLTRTAPSTLSFAGGTLATGASCTVTATVTATTAGPHDNVSGFVSSTESGTNTGGTGVATASLTAVLPPVLAKQFSPNPLFAGTVTTVTFTVTNPNQSQALSGVAFADTFPTSPGSMVVAAVPNATTSGCGSPTFTPVAGAGTITFSGGTLAGGGTCIVTVDVTAPVAGSYNNTTSPVSHLINAAVVNGNSASDTLNVTAALPAIALLKQVGPTAAGPWSHFLAVAAGGNVFYRFTVENIGNVPLSSITVTDPQVSTASCTWPEPLPVASPTQDPTATCVVGPVTAVTGTHPNTATAAGSFGGTTVNDDSTATYATAELMIVKSVTETTFSAAGDVLHYSYLVTNSGFAPLAGPVTVADDKSTDESCPAVTTVDDLDDFLDPGESLTCTATYTVTASDVTAGAVTNQASATAGGFTSNTATKTVTTPLSPPSISKAFSPNPIAVGGVSTLTFTITNSNTGTALTGVAFTDSFPAGLEVAATPNATTTGCGSPTFAPAAGNTSLSFSGGTIAASGTCTVTVDVTATTSGAKVNTTGNVTSTNGGTGNTGTDTLTVVAPPTLAKAFSPNPIAVGGASTLTFTITNSNAGTALTGVAFTDSFPAGLEVAATPNASTTGCGSSTFAPAAGNTSLSFSGGTIAASGTCTVTVDVTATTSGAKANTTSNVTSTNGGTGNTGTDTLTVLSPPSISKAFSPNTNAVGGAVVLTFTIANPNAGTALIGVAFTDSFPAGMQVAASPNASTTGCGSPTFTPAAGDTSLSFAGGTIAASGTCTVTVGVKATTSGVKVNTTGNVTSTNGGTGNTGTATFTVSAPSPIVAAAKASNFNRQVDDKDGSGTLTPGDTLLYTILITASGATDALNVVFTDTPDPNTTLVVGSVTTSLGTVTSGNLAGQTTVSVNLGTLLATGGQATITFRVSINNPFPQGVTTISNQGVVHGSNFSDVPTDDPTSTPTGDPTVDPVTVAAPAPQIPTLSEWGLILMAMLLALTAAARLRRVRSAPAARHVSSRFPR